MARSGITLAFLTLLGALSTTPPQASTGYVTDQLEITMRAGESTRYKILRMLPSGTPLDILGTSGSTGYARVRTQDGTLGYVLERQLQPEPVARAQLDEMKRRLDELMQEPSSLAKALAGLQADNQELTQTANAVEQENKRLQGELDEIRQASANIVEITDAHRRLQAQADKLAQERDDLLEENQALRSEERQHWFMIGGGVMAGGILLGLLLPHLRARRRKTAWSTI